MDPLTAALQLALTIAQVYKLQLEAMPPDVKAEFTRMQFEDLKAWRSFFQGLRLPTG